MQKLISTLLTIIFLQTNIFSKDLSGILFDDVGIIGEFIILNKEIPKKDEEKANDNAEK